MVTVCTDCYRTRLCQLAQGDRWLCEPCAYPRPRSAIVAWLLKALPMIGGAIWLLAQ